MKKYYRSQYFLLQQRIAEPRRFIQVLAGPRQVIGAHLLNFTLTENFEVFYWSEGSAEIDFVLRYKNQILGIEVKSGNIQKSAGTKVFKQRFPEARVLLDGQTGIQIEEFLDMNPVEVF